MAYSQNGWAAISSSSSPLLHTWEIPTKEGPRRIPLRRGSAGFLLCHYALWYADNIEPIATGLYDDWGWAYRDVRGFSVLSNHASGTAVDLNAVAHPLGTRTLSEADKAKLAKRMKFYSGTLRHGAFYRGRPDEMHAEINKGLAAVEKKARKLADSPRGKRILAANPGQRAVIFS